MSARSDLKNRIRESLIKDIKFSKEKSKFGKSKKGITLKNRSYEQPLSIMDLKNDSYNTKSILNNQ